MNKNMKSMGDETWKTYKYEILKKETNDFGLTISSTEMCTFVMMLVSLRSAPRIKYKMYSLKTEVSGQTENVTSKVLGLTTMVDPQLAGASKVEDTYRKRKNNTQVLDHWCVLWQSCTIHQTKRSLHEILFWIRRRWNIFSDRYTMCIVCGTES